MTTGLLGLIGAAATWGLAHTAAGPDHYLPFVALSRANRWSYARLACITLICGGGHVLSSIVLAAVGALLGKQAVELTGLQETRGEWATYLLLGIGIAYLLWGVRHSLKNRRHTHLHLHGTDVLHRHEHNHHGDHSHVHVPQKANLFWALFIIFILGPCESLIPLMLTAASRSGVYGSFCVALAFSLTTLGTMLLFVSAAHFGFSRLQLPWFERHVHALAGVVMVGCALSLLYLEPLISPGYWGLSG